MSSRAMPWRWLDASTKSSAIWRFSRISMTPAVFDPLTAIQTTYPAARRLRHEIGCDKFLKLRDAFARELGRHEFGKDFQNESGQVGGLVRFQRAVE